MAVAQQLVLWLLAGSCYSAHSVLLGTGSAVRQTPTSYYVPFQTVGADYLQAGDKRATFQYNNPFQKTGCDSPTAVRPPSLTVSSSSCKYSHIPTGMAHPPIKHHLLPCTAGLQRRDGHHDVRLPGAEDQRRV